MTDDPITAEAREFAKHIPDALANVPCADLSNVVVIGSFRTERMRREGGAWLNRWTVPMGPGDAA